jgi:hypothetical protein
MGLITFSNTRPNYIVLTLPLSLIGSIANGKAGPKLLEQGSRKPFGEDVGILRCRGNMENSNVTKGNLLSNKMEVDLNVLRPLMLHRITGEINSTDVVTIDQSSTARGMLELLK